MKVHISYMFWPSKIIREYTSRGTEDVRLVTDYEVHTIRYVRYMAVDKMYNLTANKDNTHENNNYLIISLNWVIFE